MPSTRIAVITLATACFLTDGHAAAIEAWQQKPMARWEAADLTQVLTNSPWMAYVEVEQVRDLSPGERREGGDFDAGIGTGVGIAGTGILGPRRAAEAVAAAHSRVPLGKVMVRWESALPVRFAEQKAGDKDAPELPADDYAIAIYNIATPNDWNMPRHLAEIAYLRREGKKDLRPSRVQILRHDDGTATLVYLFPRKVEITKRDGKLQFVAQIGRLVVDHTFNIADMQIQGETQLLMPTSTRP